jgi:hypothetical protein
VLAKDEVVGCIMKVIAAPEDTPWMWTLAYGYHEDNAELRRARASQSESVLAGESSVG